MLLIMIYHSYHMYFVLQYNYKCNAESIDIALNAHLSGLTLMSTTKQERK